MENRIMSLKEGNEKLARLLNEPKPEQNIWLDEITRQITNMFVLWTISQEDKGSPPRQPRS